MKKFLTVVAAVFMAGMASAQDPVSAQKGVTYGAGTNLEGVLVSTNDLSSRMEKDKFIGKVTGKVVEVCQEKGCWMKLEKSDGQHLTVKFKDYKFFMPKDIVGKDVVVEGYALVRQVTAKQQQDLAKEAGKTMQEIEKIQSEKKEIQFVASGVLVR
jgi:Domain of unknown function (DUF4920)